MKEHPILFSTPMVQAILQGKKTQTRRIIKDIPSDVYKIWFDGADWIVENKEGNCWMMGLKFPYGNKGDILWIRETWQRIEGGRFIYKADPIIWGGKWKPSIYMPHKACRIRLVITNIRAEKIQKLTEMDAIAEGIEPHLATDHPKGVYYTAFIDLWDRLNGKKHPWDNNPWVWVIEFKRID